VFLLSVIGAIASVGLPVYVTSATYAWWSLRGLAFSYSDMLSISKGVVPGTSECASFTTHWPSVRRLNRSRRNPE
jgi:hypothetical protein